MGHALHEACRVVKNGGRVVDIRPYFPANLGSRRHARQQVCCKVEDEVILVATLARDYVDFHFADRVVAEAIGNNTLATNLQTKFEFSHYLDSLALFDQYRAKWWDKAHIPVADRRLLERTMKRHRDAVIRVDTPVQLRVMTKL